MSHSDDEEQPSHHHSDGSGSGEDEESDINVEASSINGSCAEETQPEVEDNFEAEEEVLAPKPFPRTIHIMLPRPADNAAGLERQPTCIHVCLTRGVIDLPTQQVGGEEKDEGMEESGLLTAAARMQGCCADAHCFETDYASQLAALRRRHILRRLHGDVERQRRFLQQERKNASRRPPQGGEAEEGDEGSSPAAPHGNGENEHNELGDGANPGEGVTWPWTSAQQPPPYWLPSLLANDAHTFHRVLQVMYGWVITPEPHPSDFLRLNSAGKLLSGPSDGTAHGGDDDDEDLEQADPAHHKPDFFLPSNAFGSGDEEEVEEEEEEEDGDVKEESALTDNGDNTHRPQRPSKSLMNDFNECDVDADGAVVPSPSAQAYEKNPSQAKLSAATAPPPVVALPSFPFTDYEFYIAHDTASGEWHLLDTHPLFVMEACRRRRAEQREKLGQSVDNGNAGNQHGHDAVDGAGEGDNADDVNGRSTDRVSQGQEENNSSNNHDDSGSLYPIPVYDMHTLIPVNPILLAALFSAPALRCCLLQPVKATNSDGSAVIAVEEEGDAHESGSGGRIAMRQRVSDRDVLRTFDQAWLAIDAVVALPILATICRARQHVLQQDTTRIPYALSPVWLDVSPLFAMSTLHDITRTATAEDVRQWCVGPGEKALDAEVEEEGGDSGNKASSTEDDKQQQQQGQLPSRPATAMALSTALPHQWGSALDHILSSGHYGRLVLSALLAADVLPTRAVRLALFTRLGGLRLALWWWLRLPQRLIRRWGVDGEEAAAEEEEAAANAEGGAGDDENAEDNDDVDRVEGGDAEALLDGMGPQEATEVLAQRVVTMQQRNAHEHRRRQRQQHGPTLVFAPLLQRIVLELQRRLNRAHGEDGEGNPLPPSQFTLQESVARTYAVERLDSGRPRQDPLVTSAFTGVSVSDSSASSCGNTEQADEPAATPATAAAMSRHHRLYQSDLVLLVLALTTTPAPGQMQTQGEAAAAAAAAASQRTTALEVEDDTTAAGTEAAESDGHTAFFQQLFEAKRLRCVRSPVDRARAGTTKLLLLCAADICLSATRRCVFAHLPPYELFGSTGYCPLPELVQAWAGAATRNNNSTTTITTADQQMQRTATDFAFYHWNEVRWRLCKGQYSEAVVQRMREQVPELFTLVDSHANTYYAILTRLQAEAEAEAAEASAIASGPFTSSSASPFGASRLPLKSPTATAASVPASRHPQRPSLVSDAVLQAAKQDARAAAATAAAYGTITTTVNTSSVASPAASLSPYVAIVTAPPASSVPLTLTHPNIYSAAVLEAKTHVYDLWAAFPAAPATYLTPETLHVLLFGRPTSAVVGESGSAEGAATSSQPHRRHFQTAALRVLLENGIHTVQPCPLDTAEIPAMEAALSRTDVAAVQVLLGLGAASLHDLRTDGGATFEAWAESIFSPAEVEVLHLIDAKNGRATRSDPRVQYGARRFEATTAQAK
jgi:hypothetical protein